MVTAAYPFGFRDVICLIYTLSDCRKVGRLWQLTWCPIKYYVYYQYLHYWTGVGIAVGNVKDRPVIQEGLSDYPIKAGLTGVS